MTLTDGDMVRIDEPREAQEEVELLTTKETKFKESGD